MSNIVPKQITVIVSFVMLNLLAVIALGLRFYSLYLLHRKFNIPDALCIVSLVTLIAYSIDILVGTRRDMKKFLALSDESNRDSRRRHWPPYFWAYIARDDGRIKGM